MPTLSTEVNAFHTLKSFHGQRLSAVVMNERNGREAESVGSKHGVAMGDYGAPRGSEDSQKNRGR